MPKEFYTERDIEDLVKRGTSELELSDNTVLTELAYEKAHKLGLKLNSRALKPPAAPERPYLSTEKPRVTPQVASASPEPEIRQRIKDSVQAKLGQQLDPALLDSIITRVLEALNRK